MTSFRCLIARRQWVEGTLNINIELVRFFERSDLICFRVCCIALFGGFLTSCMVPTASNRRVYRYTGSRVVSRDRSIEFECISDACATDLLSTSSLSKKIDPFVLVPFKRRGVPVEGRDIVEKTGSDTHVDCGGMDDGDMCCGGYCYEDRVTATWLADFKNPPLSESRSALLPPIFFSVDSTDPNIIQLTPEEPLGADMMYRVVPRPGVMLESTPHDGLDGDDNYLVLLTQPASQQELKIVLIDPQGDSVSSDLRRIIVWSDTMLPPDLNLALVGKHVSVSLKQDHRYTKQQFIPRESGANVSEAEVAYSEERRSGYQFVYRPAAPITVGKYDLQQIFEGENEHAAGLRSMATFSGSTSIDIVSDLGEESIDIRLSTAQVGQCSIATIFSPRPIDVSFNETHWFGRRSLDLVYDIENASFKGDSRTADSEVSLLSSMKIQGRGGARAKIVQHISLLDVVLPSPHDSLSLVDGVADRENDGIVSTMAENIEGLNGGDQPNAERSTSALKFVRILFDAVGPETKGEYIVVANTSERDLNLDMYELSDGRRRIQLPQSILAAKEAVRLVGQGFDVSQISEQSNELLKEVVLPGSLGLANGGEPLYLIDAFGHISDLFEPRWVHGRIIEGQELVREGTHCNQLTVWH